MNLGSFEVSGNYATGIIRIRILFVRDGIKIHTLLAEPTSPQTRSLNAPSHCCLVFYTFL